MKETLGLYVRTRAKELNLSVTDVCKQSGLSRQTIYSLDAANAKLPTLPTIIALADTLRVHPLRLLHLVFDNLPGQHCLQQRRHPGDQSAFVRDVNFADGELVLPGQIFTKTWELQNVGKVPWENRFLQCMDEDVVVTTRRGEVMHVAQNLRPTALRVSVPYTEPGQLVQVSAEFTAPQAPGTVLSYWKSVFSDGVPCFPKARGLWVKVRVNNPLTRAFAAR